MRNNTSNCRTQPDLNKGVSFAKMQPRDDSMYRVSDISFLRAPKTLKGKNRRHVMIK